MAYLYLTHQGAVVRRRGDALVVEADDRTLAELVSHRLDGLCIFGRVHLTIPAVELLLSRGIETAFLTLTGRLKGQLTPVRPRNVTLRLEQFRRFLDPAERLDLARLLVRAKLTNARAVLRRFAYNHPGEVPGGLCDDLKAAIAAAARAGDLNSLHGIEGEAPSLMRK